jgi:hypothetical protein
LVVGGTVVVVIVVVVLVVVALVGNGVGTAFGSSPQAIRIKLEMNINKTENPAFLLSAIYYPF